MATKQASIQAGANIVKLEESEIRTEKKIDWDEIAKKAGIIVAIITALGFFISIFGLIITIYSNVIDFSNRQTVLMIELTDRISQLEGKLEILLRKTDP